jgi:hypothetical protein
MPQQDVVYEFRYTDCYHEAPPWGISLHRTKAGAYRAMRKSLVDAFTEWYDERIKYGKRERGGQFEPYALWKVSAVKIED